MAIGITLPAVWGNFVYLHPEKWKNMHISTLIIQLIPK